MPLLVKLHAALYALGLDPKDTEFDHHPALAFRERTADGGYIPDENDPHFIVPRSKADHRTKTSGRRGEKKVTAAGSDVHAAAKIKRLAPQQTAFQQRLLAKAAGDEKPKSRWPRRPMGKK